MEGGHEIPFDSTTWSHYAFTEPDGTVHPFNVSFTEKSPECGGGSTGTNSGYATDASGYYLSGGSSVIAPSGINSTNSGQTDTNGNFVSSATTSGETDWTDTAGRLALKVISSATNIKYEYQDTSGTYQIITLNLTNHNVKTNFACSGVVEYTSSGTIALPSSVVYPNGTQYSFTYEPTPGNAGYVTGRVSEVTLPNGGTISYTFGSTNDGINCSDSTIVNLTRAIYDGTNTATWTFSRAPSGSNWITTVTAPLMPYDTAANQSVFAFNSAGQETQQKFYQGSTGGTLLRTINKTWAANLTPATAITILEDNSTQSEVETTYDAYGNLGVLKEHDYGTGAPGAVLRTTNYTYSSAYATQNIMDRVTEKTIADSTGTTQYREDTAYDGTTLSPCTTGVSQHNDTTYGCSFTSRGNLTSITMYTNAAAPSGGVTKNSYYNVFGDLVQKDADCCQTMSWNFSATTNYSLPDSVVSGASGGLHTTTNYTYNSYTGQIASITDPNTQITSFAYDSMRRPTQTTRPDSAQLITSYNDSSHSVSNSQPIQGTAVVKNTAYLDGLGRASQTSTFDASNNLYSTTQTEYDGMERSYKVSNPFTSTAQYWTETTYDALGRKAKIILPDSSQTSFAYSAATSTETDPAGHQRKMQTDGLNRLSVVYEPDPTNGNSLTLQSSYAYNVLNNLATLTQGSQTRSFVYDGMGRLTSQTLPESATTSFQYNSYNLMSQRTDARGVITSYTYDTMNRAYQITYNVGTTGVAATPTVTYAYGTNAAQFNNGNLLSLTDGLGTTTYSYDSLSRATQAQHVISGLTYTVGYQYNLAGSVTSLTYPSSRVVQQNYDAIGRLSSITSGATTYASSFSYNAAFAATNYSMGNGVAVTMGYSASRLQLQSLNYTGTSTVFSTTYGYTQNGGNNGQITSITDSVDSGRSITYTYDALNRISTAVTTGSTNYSKWGMSFAFDRYGNRTGQSVTAGTAVANSVVVSTTTNHITTAGYGYDLNGNLTNDGVNALAYDAENRLVSATGSGGSGTYSYRASGIRAVRASGGATTVYLFDGNRNIAEYVNGTLANEYIYWGDRLIASHLSGVLYYQVSDHQSVRVHLDTSGSIVGQKGHYPFGEDWYVSSLTNRHFTSYARDSESSNDNALHRFYVSRLGRFSANDPIPAGGQTPQGFNLSSYSQNDAVNNSDPDGQVRLPCTFPLRDCLCDLEFFCSPGGDPGDPGGGGGGCTPDGVEGDPCPPAPVPPPPPSKPKCFCQLKYRPVDDPNARKVRATHSFWYIQDPVGYQRIISAGPSNPNGGGFLNDFINPRLHSGVDNVSAATWFNTGFNSSSCLSAQIIESTALAWTNNVIPYHFFPGPNSNSFANYLGETAFLYIAPPPGSFGWYHFIP